MSTQSLTSVSSLASSSSSSSSSSNNNNQKQKKHVDFESLTIREYPVILGDNPNVSSGAPLSLGWEYTEQPRRNIDMYEYTRKERRSRKHLAIPVEVRGQILLKMGYSIEELAMATMESDEIKRQRAESMRSSPANMIMDRTKDLPKNVVNGMARLFTMTNGQPIKPHINRAAAKSA
eukprot:CAMPEP_0113482596 /NCGR_PEP_ID=MMETSP0014_2-20120614/23001_1 /TAXON_ID=2857 /ORGANISM="Nitzschia sp." /LENGTH=176 /DNA_ID=CAMNT_0000376119 /DNA_START=127 /DNA_END=657 /DNA_ORIENTATION=- /assembly_acc=CAM_ASM_000159